ncbi:dUTP pyrophosphatase [Rhizobium rosettiformans]|uniref:dUTP diphosphatase n=2 Tax=Rhizobium rosettiformans TaxID=1368430 RepID=A0A4S8PYS4_9HYPH|nr:dUTP diphosphatase [Rhizobium rosettiformans]MBB5276263.1 dUTP pyrophosphatase [Rhizobium rosettiformans]THV36897.1 dUTP diphosphatase [Rhizobium rosettiformans W3]
MTLPVKKLSPTATIPTRGSAQAAGLDLYLDQDELILHSGRREAASTGIAVAIPEGYYGRVAPRSGLSAKQGIDVLAGVIDSDYRGEIKVLLLNTDRITHVFRRGDRIAQLILEQIKLDDPIEVAELPDTNRGDAGFGSTGQ